MSDDGLFRLPLGESSSVGDVIRGIGVPKDRVSITMLNGRHCQVEADIKPGDRVVLIPPDVAALWRFLCRQNLNAEGVLDL